MFRLGRKDKFSVGLDLGTKEIKLVKIELNKENPKLIGFTKEPVSEDLSGTLKKFSQEHNFNKVNIAVSGASAIIRYIDFPLMREEELKQALKFEAEKHIPFPISELNVDGYILKTGLPENKMLVLVAAVKKDFLNQRLKLMEEAGLKVNLVDVDSLALINAFNFNYPNFEKNKTFALLNLGASFSNLNILEESIPVLSRDIQIGANIFIQRISEILSLDFETAQELITNLDDETAKKVSPILDSFLSNLASEIRTSFDYYESQHASSVSKIFLSGGLSLCPQIRESLMGLLDIAVDCWDPLARIKIAEDLDKEKIKNVSRQLAVAIGLALRT